MTTLPLDKLCRRLDAAIANGRGCEMPADELFLLAHYAGTHLREVADAEAGRIALPDPSDRPEPVYFIQRGSAGPVKIGRARDPYKRLAALQTASAEPLALIACTRRYSEWTLHRFYHAERLCGEWFRPSPRLLAFVRHLELAD